MIKEETKKFIKKIYHDLPGVEFTFNDYSVIVRAGGYTLTYEYTTVVDEISVTFDFEGKPACLGITALKDAQEVMEKISEDLIEY